MKQQAPIPFGTTAILSMLMLTPEELDAARPSNPRATYVTNPRLFAGGPLAHLLDVAVHEYGPLHVMGDATSNRRKSQEVVVHACKQTHAFPVGSFLRLSDGSCLPAPELAFVQAASQMSTVDCIQMGLMLCGSWRLVLPAHSKTVDRPAPRLVLDDYSSVRYGRAPLTTTNRLISFVEHCPQMWGRKQAAQALKWVRDGSGSPREAQLHMLAALPSKMGGFELGIPSPNYPVKLSRQAATIAHHKVVRLDLYWPQCRCALEYDSDEFHSHKRSNDIDRVQALATMGVEVVTVTTSQFNDFNRLAGCFMSLRNCMGLRNRSINPSVSRRRREFYWHLRQQSAHWLFARSER